MRVAVALAAVGAALTLAMPAPAQEEWENPTGSRVGRARPARIPEQPGLSPADRARVTIDEFAECIVTRDPRRTSAYLDLKYGDPEADKLLVSAVSNECLYEGKLGMPLDLLRGAIYRALYLRDVKASDVPFQEKPIDFASHVTDITVTKVRNHAIMMNFASCVVRADAANSRAYLLAGPGRSGEMRALAALQPQFGPCFPAGGNLTLNKSVLSAKLAEALYREAMAARTNMPEAPR